MLNKNHFIRFLRHCFLGNGGHLWPLFLRHCFLGNGGHLWPLFLRHCFLGNDKKNIFQVVCGQNLLAPEVFTFDFLKILEAIFEFATRKKAKNGINLCAVGIANACRSGKIEIENVEYDFKRE